MKANRMGWNTRTSVLFVLLATLCFLPGCSLAEAVTGGFFAGISNAIAETVSALLLELATPT